MNQFAARHLLLAVTIFLILLLLSAASGRSNFLRADPDTTCTAAYQKDPSSCLSTNDHFGRPCQLCQSGADTFCYNADEARWAKIFGAKCETAPGNAAADDGTIDTE